MVRAFRRVDAGGHAVLNQPLVEGTRCGVTGLDDANGRQPLARPGHGSGAEHDACVACHVQFTLTIAVAGGVAGRTGRFDAKGVLLRKQRQDLLFEVIVVFGAVVDPLAHHPDLGRVCGIVEGRPEGHPVVLEVAAQAAASRIAGNDDRPGRLFGRPPDQAGAGGKVEPAVAALGVGGSVANDAGRALAEGIGQAHQGIDVGVGNLDIAFHDQPGHCLLVGFGIVVGGAGGWDSGEHQHQPGCDGGDEMECR